MALLKGTVNPLNVIGQRRLNFIPTHFEKITVAMQNVDNSIANLEHWIYHNLNSRYCLHVKQVVDSERRMIDMCEIGLEDPRELTMMSLSCPHLHKQK